MVTIDGWEVLIYHDQKRTQLTVPKELSADQTKIIFYDSRDRLWLGTPENGIFLYDSGTWSTYGENEQLAGNPISNFVEDADGNVWIATRPPYDQDNKTYHLPNLHILEASGTWSHFSPKEGLVQFSALDLAVRPDGSIVIATNGGISVVDRQGKLTNYGPKQGLAPYFVYSLAVDPKNHVWMAHQYYGDGITWFDGKNFYRVDVKHGFFTDRISSLAHDQNQRVWLFASNGTVGVYPRSSLEHMKTVIPLNIKQVMTRSLLE